MVKVRKIAPYMKKITFSRKIDTLRQQWQQSGAVSAGASQSAVIADASAVGIHAHFERHNIDQQSWAALLQLAHDIDLQDQINAAFSGARINTTEDRPVLHTALRRPLDQPLMVDGHNVMQEVAASQARMATIVDQLHQEQKVEGHPNTITDIIHIGIGGSDLGPVMLQHALQPYAHHALRYHFFSNVDQAYLQQKLATIDPSTTVVMIVSKSFTTYETLTNARFVRRWLQESGLSQDVLKAALFAVTASPNLARDFGIPSGHILPFWSWVGGRFSVWSAVSLTVAMSIGMQRYREFLAGGYAMDQHFQQAEYADNLPVIMGLLGVWYGNVLQATTQAVISYSEYLRHFSDYLQQLHMESLGKQVSHAGMPLGYTTGRILWGGVGTSSQHSFHQLLMQGTHLIPIDFILPLHAATGQRNDDLIANCLAQAELLWTGESLRSVDQQDDRLRPHKQIGGCRPSTLLVVDRLSPYQLGTLIALYEHSVFVRSLVWDINAYDQWGVESGKKAAATILQALHTGNTEAITDLTTQNILKQCKAPI